jgi:hypothetical protein
LDLKKLLAEPQPKRQQFVPARAGWDGPEQNAKAAVYFQQLSTPNSPQAMKATLLNVLVPDWRVVLALLSVIFLLRHLRTRATPKERLASPPEPSTDVPRAA